MDLPRAARARGSRGTHAAALCRAGEARRDESRVVSGDAMTGTRDEGRGTSSGGRSSPIPRPSSLFGDPYDLVIVGAGIYGAFAAWDAALRGLRVALIDRGDFGGETSANSLKIVHGGLRHLQSADLTRVREGV